ncbi:hypothetical protein Spico_1375 [Parasphaerochaeta coccoides DSM 17374]|uniref:Transcriptional regulator n=1 Tax=Parasphaerochaeta coccoides (strain ATCC BAA-1237 / DSM 17374 / SPN1) TaxID=760011 RepID=F4GHJ1_PARC1|nr:hypothetical protein Spico_1375 [Parasphaerochaeta coccoides DSM 17374]
MTKEHVLDLIKAAGKPVGPSDIAKSSGLDKDEIAKAFDALKKDGAIYSPVRCKYAPAEEQS